MFLAFFSGIDQFVVLSLLSPFPITNFLTQEDHENSPSVSPVPLCLVDLSNKQVAVLVP